MKKQFSNRASSEKPKVDMHTQGAQCIPLLLRFDIRTYLLWSSLQVYALAAAALATIIALRARALATQCAHLNASMLVGTWAFLRK